MIVDETPGILPDELEQFEQSCWDADAVGVHHELDSQTQTYTVIAIYPGDRQAAAPLSGNEGGGG